MGVNMEAGIIKARQIRDADLDVLHHVRDELAEVGRIILQAQAKMSEDILNEAETLLRSAMGRIDKPNFKTFCIGMQCEADDVEMIENHPVLYAALQEHLDGILGLTKKRPKPTLVVADPKSKVMLAIDETDFSSHVFYKPIGEDE